MCRCRTGSRCRDGSVRRSISRRLGLYRSPIWRDSMPCRTASPSPPTLIGCLAQKNWGGGTRKPRNRSRRLLPLSGRSGSITTLGRFARAARQITSFGPTSCRRSPAKSCAKHSARSLLPSSSSTDLFHSGCDLSEQDFQLSKDTHAADLARLVQMAAKHLGTPKDLPGLPNRERRGIRRELKEVVNESRRGVRNQYIDPARVGEPRDIYQGDLLFRPPVHPVPPYGSIDNFVSAPQGSHTPHAL